MKKLHKKGNRMAYTEVDSSMISMTVGDSIGNNWDEYDVSDLDTKKIKKDPSKYKRHTTKSRRVI